MDEEMTVSVVVPRSRLSELYDLCSRWLRDLEASEGKPGRRSWGTDESLSDAQELYRTISGPAREFLDFLIDHPGDRFSANELVAGLDSSDLRDVARLTGSLPSITRRAKMLGPDGDVPYQYEEGQYWLDSDVSKVFAQAREEWIRGQGMTRGKSRYGDQAPRGEARVENPDPEEAPMTDKE